MPAACDQYSFYYLLEPVFQKDYSVLFTASWFPYVMLRPILMMVQREVRKTVQLLKLSQEIRSCIKCCNHWEEKKENKSDKSLYQGHSDQVSHHIDFTLLFSISLVQSFSFKNTLAEDGDIYKWLHISFYINPYRVVSEFNFMYGFLATFSCSRMISLTS